MRLDIGEILREWEFDPEGVNMRKILGADGREKIQIRVQVDSFDGLLQFDCDGRPDGKRPHEREFALDHFEELAGGGGEFLLSQDDAQELFAEAAMIYHRYVLMLQIGDYDRVLRDTERNMRLFDFVHRLAEEDEDRDHLEKWWPYIIRIHATAKALRLSADGDVAGAAKTLSRARNRIEGLPDREDETFQIERERSVDALEELMAGMVGGGQPSRLERLKKEQREAIAREDYERAAALRDEIAGMLRNGGDEA